MTETNDSRSTSGGTGTSDANPVPQLSEPGSSVPPTNLGTVIERGINDPVSPGYLTKVINTPTPSRESQEN